MTPNQTAVFEEFAKSIPGFVTPSPGDSLSTPSSFSNSNSRSGFEQNLYAGEVSRFNNLRESYLNTTIHFHGQTIFTYHILECKLNVSDNTLYFNNIRNPAYFLCIDFFSNVFFKSPSFFLC